MTAMTVDTVDSSNTGRADRGTPKRIPLTRVIAVELRKMFNTRSGFWLMASIVIAGVGTTVGIILLAPDSELTYYTFARAIGFPMAIILPMIAILSITGEWSQRSGLTTFTLVPRRNRVIAAKVLTSLGVGVAAMLFAIALGAVGNVVGTAVTGTDLVWDVSVTEAANIVLGSLLCLLTGTMLGMLIRSSVGALVVYFMYAFVLPSLYGVLMTSVDWFPDVRPWVDLNHAEAFLFSGEVTGEQWANIAVTAGIWIILPALLGLRLAMRSEVK
jgi:hypothetical protein